MGLPQVLIVLYAISKADIQVAGLLAAGEIGLAVDTHSKGSPLTLECSCSSVPLHAPYCSIRFGTYIDLGPSLT